MYSTSDMIYNYMCWKIKRCIQSTQQDHQTKTPMNEHTNTSAKTSINQAMITTTIPIQDTWKFLPSKSVFSSNCKASSRTVSTGSCVKSRAVSCSFKDTSPLVTARSSADFLGFIIWIQQWWSELLLESPTHINIMRSNFHRVLKSCMRLDGFFLGYDPLYPWMCLCFSCSW